MLKLKPLFYAPFYSLLIFFLCSKKPLDHSVYDAWESVGSRLISNDGKWLGYYVDARKKETEISIYILPLIKLNKNFNRASKLFLTSDSKFAIFTVKPFYKDIKSGKR